MIRPPFERIEITIPPGESIAPSSCWDDAIVVVEEGDVELVGPHGATLRVGCGGVLWLSDVSVRNGGPNRPCCRSCTGTIAGVCMNCLSTAEAAIAQTAFLGYVVKDPVHRALARAGLVGAPDPAARDARTIAFLGGGGAGLMSGERPDER